MNIVLIGKPGAGKGFVSSYLQEKYDFVQISTGNLLRKHVNEKTDIGLVVQDVMAKGQLVNDGIIFDILKYEIAELNPYANYIFDGFPRTLFQAKILDEMINVNCAIFVDCKDEVIISRLADRKVCLGCGKTNINGNNGEICEFCGGKLTVRDDDKPEVVKSRISTFNEISKPIIDYYKAKNLLHIVDNSNNKEQTFESIDKVLDKLLDEILDSF